MELLLDKYTIHSNISDKIFHGSSKRTAFQLSKKMVFF
jgi:hypothetical protein